MITNVGKGILGKYLIGQTPSYASHIAIGSGANPLSVSDTFSNYSTKTALDFEVARAPITSRGYVVENGVENIVFTAQLPTANEYSITEIGLYPSSTNASVPGINNKILYSFNRSENWEVHSSGVVSSIPYLNNSLDAIGATFDSYSVIEQPGGPDLYQLSLYPIVTGDILTIAEPVAPAGATIIMTGTSNTTGRPVTLVAQTLQQYTIINGLMQLSIDRDLTPIYAAYTIDSYAIETGSGVFFDSPNVAASYVSGSNSFFSNLSRLERKEKPRVLSESLMVRGDTGFSFPGDASPATHIHLTGVSVDLSKNLPTDEIKLAFSMIDSVRPESTGLITDASITVEFSSSESDEFRQFAKFTASPSQLYPGYYVVSSQIQELETTSQFSWDVVNTIIIYAQISGAEWSDLGTDRNPTYIVFDALRIDNPSTTNPLYGLVGYSVIKTDNGQPIEKSPNTTSLVEFRFALEI